jgi:trimethylamine:corrinoid methyltransferase-like protein
MYQYETIDSLQSSPAQGSQPQTAAPNTKPSSLADLPMLEKIHHDALRVLEEVGVSCTSAEVRRLFEDTGMAGYDESTQKLYILSPLVEQALATAPGRDAYWVENNAFGIGGTAPFTYDDASQDLVQPTFEHLESIARIADKSPEVAFMARGVLIPKQEVKVMDLLAANCSKPLYVAAVTQPGIARAKELSQTRGRVTVQFSIINSPLRVIESMVDPFLSCVRENIPVYVSTMPMAGLSAPYSMSGLLTLTHAEALFGITLAQLANPQIMVVHAGLPSLTDISNNYSLDLGRTSHTLANLLLDKINEKLNLPSIHSGCTTNEDHPGPKAEQDALKAYGLLKKHGFHQIRHSFGFLKDLVAFSEAKLLRHIEILRSASADDAPTCWPDDFDPHGFEAIARNGSIPGYMNDDHTLRNMSVQFRC